MRAIALLGGPKSAWPSNIKQVLAANDALLIGVDRGSLLLEEMGLAPDLAVGDFDSLKSQELAKIERDVTDLRYSVPEKDLTDTELMVKYAFEDYHVDSLTLLGATGGRLDHLLANLLMVLKTEFINHAPKITLLDQQNFVQFYVPGAHIIKKAPGYSYFGLFSLTSVRDLKITGARYNLADYANDFPICFSSNEFMPGQDSFKLTFSQGLVAVIQSRDVDRFQNI